MFRLLEKTINFELPSISYSLQNKDIWLFDILEGIQITKSYVSLFFAIPHDIYLQKNQFKRTIFVSFGRKGMRSLFLFRISPTDQRLRRSLDNRNGGNTTWTMPNNANKAHWSKLIFFPSPVIKRKLIEQLKFFRCSLLLNMFYSTILIEKSSDFVLEIKRVLSIFRVN